MVTSRHKPEEELKNTRIMEYIAQGITDRVMVISKDFKVLWANRAFLEEDGLSLDDVIGKHCYKLTHGRDSICDPDSCTIQALMATGHPETKERVQIGQDGSQHFFEETAYPIRDSKGEITQFIRVFRDVTDLKMMKEELQDSRDRYRQFLDKGRSVNMLVEAGGKIMYMNERGMAMFGRMNGDIIGRNIVDFVVPEQREMATRMLTSHISGESASSFEVDVLGRDAIHTLLFTESYTAFYKENEPMGMLLSAIDISERKRSEQALKSELDLQRIISGISSRFVGGITIDLAIDSSLEDMCRLYRATRGYVFLFSENLSSMTNTHEWCAPGTVPKKASLQNVPIRMFLWRMKRLNKGEIIYVEDVSRLSDEALSERSLLQSQGVRSLVLLPLYMKGNLSGMVGFENAIIKAGTRDLELLHVASDMIGNALGRKRAEEQVSRLASFPELNPNPVVEADFSGSVLYANPAALNAFPDIREPGPRHPFIPAADGMGPDFLSGRGNLEREVMIGDRWYRQQATCIPQLRCMRIYGRDVTERRRKEDELRRLNRTLNALSNSSQAMLRATDEQSYLQEVCRIIVEDCGHAMVWIGFAEDDEKKTVRPAAFAGFDEGYISKLDITWADTERGRGPTGTAIRTLKPCGCANILTDPAFRPWREEALRRGYASSMVFPLVYEGRALGAINIYSREQDPFSEEEIKLLLELADDLAYGIQAMRLRAMHARAAEALRETKDYLENLIAYANAPIIVWDPSFRITRFNHAFERLTGLKEAEVLGKPLDMLFPESSKELSLGYIRRTQSGEHWETVEIPILNADGSVHIVLWNSATLFGKDGSPLATIAQGHDITERNKVEAERERLLQEIQQRGRKIEKLARGAERERDLLKAVMENTEAHLAYLDKDFNFVTVNSAYVRGCGRKESELIGKSHFELFPDMENERAFKEVRSTGRAIQFKSKPFQFPDQPWRGVTYWDWTLIPIKNGGGRVQGLVLSLIDVTEREREKDAYFRTILRTTMDGFFMLDKEGRFLEANDVYCRLVGFTRAELLTMSIWDLDASESEEDSRGHIQRIMGSGNDHFRARYRRRDGMIVHVYVEASYMEIEGEKIFAFVREASARKR